MCQHHHLLQWKNRMAKKILGLSLILMDFDAVWHLRRRDKEEEPKSSLSSGPDTHCKRATKHPCPCPWHLRVRKATSCYCAVLLQWPFHLLPSVSVRHICKTSISSSTLLKFLSVAASLPPASSSPTCPGVPSAETPRKAAQHVLDGLALGPRLRCVWKVLKT